MYADEIGIRVIRDSINITGAFATGTGKSGILDSMMIGDIAFKNAIITIADPNPAVDTVYQVDAVLGTDFMRLVGEVNIFPQEKRFAFRLIGIRFRKPEGICGCMMVVCA